CAGEVLPVGAVELVHDHGECAPLAGQARFDRHARALSVVRRHPGPFQHDAWQQHALSQVARPLRDQLGHAGRALAVQLAQHAECGVLARGVLQATRTAAKTNRFKRVGPQQHDLRAHLRALLGHTCIAHARTGERAHGRHDFGGGVPVQAGALAAGERRG
ncbi:hypothetical protein KXX48_000782, partial [Aspergillus fumigatus]